MKRVAERIAQHRVAAGPAALASIWPLVAGIALAWLLQQWLAPAIGPFYAKVLLDIGIAIVAASSLNIVNGFGGQFSLGHAGFMMVGGYAAAWLTFYGSIQLWGSPGLHGGFLGGGDLLFLGGCLLAGVIAALAGLLVGLPSLRLRGDYLAIVTLGFGEIMRVLVQRTGDVMAPAQAQEAGMTGTIGALGGSLGFGGVPTYTRVFYVYVFVAIVVMCAYRLKISSRGRALLAVRENEVAAESVGINTARVKVQAFVMSAFFAGIGGALFAHELGTTLNPRELGFQKSIDIVIMVVLGGMGSISGVVLAAAILTIMPELFREFADYRMPIYALALIIVMIVRPQGLFGIKELWDTQLWGRLVGKSRGKPTTPRAIARELRTERAGGEPAKRVIEAKPPIDPSKPEDAKADGSVPESADRPAGSSDKEPS
jgi:branched-chain amino acid transport system permease protein